MPIASLASDLDAIIAHAGVPVTIAGVTGSGFPRTEDVVVTGASGALEVIGQQFTLTVREGVFPGIGSDVAATINGTSYIIRDPGKPKTDGTRKLVLVEATP